MHAPGPKSHEISHKNPGRSSEIKVTLKVIKGQILLLNGVFLNFLSI